MYQQHRNVIGSGPANCEEAVKLHRSMGAKRLVGGGCRRGCPPSHADSAEATGIWLVKEGLRGRMVSSGGHEVACRQVL